MRFDTFDDAFFYAKNRFENHLEETLSTPVGVSFMTHLLCISKLLPYIMLPGLAKRYDIALGIFDMSPREVDEYPCENAEELHISFDRTRSVVLNNKRQHNPSILGDIQRRFIVMAEEFCHPEEQVDAISIRMGRSRESD